MTYGKTLQFGVKYNPDAFRSEVLAYKLYF